MLEATSKERIMTESFMEWTRRSFGSSGMPGQEIASILLGRALKKNPFPESEGSNERKIYRRIPTTQYLQGFVLILGAYVPLSNCESNLAFLSRHLTKMVKPFRDK
jgi:hypothetical protein